VIIANAHILMGGADGKRGVNTRSLAHESQPWRAVREPAIIARFVARRKPNLGKVKRFLRWLLGIGNRIDDAKIAPWTTSAAAGQRELAARAHLARGGTLRENGRWDEALAVYEEVLTRFGSEIDPELLERVAAAFIGKGVALERLNRAPEAIANYHEAIAR